MRGKVGRMVSKEINLRVQADVIKLLHISPSHSLVLLNVPVGLAVD